MYEYDVFLSYRRKGGTVPAWVRTHFHPRLAELLDDYLDHEAKIFFDDQVPAGTAWPLEVRNALQRAKVLVAVCSPKYFSSEWCLAEWHSMARREELTGLATPERPQGLIYPVIFCDSENFPKYAHERRMLDLKRWNQPYQQFQDSPAYLDFHRNLQVVATELAGLIAHAPEWRPDWPVETPLPDPPPTSRLPRF
ncbi:MULTISPECIES: toll/interleukin-1 receptor domain-containing protein [Amycolatopsis]|uniref:TIR domain-containing protein n=2 Tax=Amycolatopsis TaxID=1813 RepID=A0A1I3VLI2_9PSEU|nr:toll/interleukin-1 receptor domain-containing protein [Amycolatopsis sacchari]SFJ96095.1 TIR domain-containing protein [Amycolatopsis sacchari]